MDLNIFHNFRLTMAENNIPYRFEDELSEENLKNFRHLRTKLMLHAIKNIVLAYEEFTKEAQKNRREYQQQLLSVEQLMILEHLLIDIVYLKVNKIICNTERNILETKLYFMDMEMSNAPNAA